MDPAEYKTVQIGVSPFWAKKYAREAGRNWNKFYKRNENRFFRDRHWTNDEANDGFPALSVRHDPPAHVLEVGCGVGNCALPLLEVNPTLHIAAFDFAPAAVALAASRGAELPEAQAARFQAFEWDFTSDVACPVPLPTRPPLTSAPHPSSATSPDASTSSPAEPSAPSQSTKTTSSTTTTSLPQESEMTSTLASTSPSASPVTAPGYDYATLVFVLSAVPPAKHVHGLRALTSQLRPGGVLLFRDYASGDLAMQRFQSRNRIEDNYFVRQDGTLAVFFDEDGLQQTMQQAGLRMRYVRRVHRVVRNRKDKLEMHRVFLQGEFERPG